MKAEEERPSAQVRFLTPGLYTDPISLPGSPFANTAPSHASLHPQNPHAAQEEGGGNTHCWGASRMLCGAIILHLLPDKVIYGPELIYASSPPLEISPIPGEAQQPEATCPEILFQLKAEADLILIYLPFPSSWILPHGAGPSGGKGPFTVGAHRTPPSNPLRGPL